MRKILIPILIIMTAVCATSCTPSSDATLPTAEKKAIATTAQPTEKPDPNAPKINEEIVEKATRGNVTEPAEEDTKATEATEPTEKKKKKKKTSQIPTQGEVNPNLDIQVTTAPSGKIESSDFDFELDGAYIYLGDEIDDVVALAGDDNSVTELSETEFLYEYDGLSFTTVVKGKKETVKSITVSSADFPTQKGAVVGMYATQLRTFYGEADKKSETLYSYTSGKKKLDFAVEDNIVTSIRYSS